MGIKDVPESYEQFEACLDAYDEAHFGWTRTRGGSRTRRST